jgi:hypothetical protein
MFFTMPPCFIGAFYFGAYCHLLPQRTFLQILIESVVISAVTSAGNYYLIVRRRRKTQEAPVS